MRLSSAAMLIRPFLHLLIAVCLSSQLAAAPATAPASAPVDTCLMFAARNIAKGLGNFFVYCAFADDKIHISKGDVLEYDVCLDPANPMAVGGIDVDPTNGAGLRDTKAVDQNGLRAHGDADLSRASGKWYHRRIALDPFEGRTTRSWNVVFEGDKAGRYIQFIDNVIITRADGSHIVVYDNGDPRHRELHGKEGYSQHVLLTSVPRDQVVDGKDISALIEQKMQLWSRQERLDAIRTEVETASVVAQRSDNEHLKAHVAEAREALAKLENTDDVSEESFQAVLHQVQGSLNHEHPEMRRYTGHLVGHAHIDFQWLWEWPETIGVCKQTFGQAIKFMAEFPEFKFSQSSSALYAATEQNFPELFKQIQYYVKRGQWEIVGGRVCEGDEHMISPESHARQFLYGQRYFRERFDGKSATVGWEPDTFGHTATFPQILKLGGCKYFYFCRGGRGAPLFWWEAPDGSRVLAFEEPATGGWYNGQDINGKLFDRLFNFESTVGSRDMLWVYGVGNHGGGPTRENIEQALDWQKKPYLPNVKFSTATEFFNTIEKSYDLSKIPVIKDDLNTPSNGGFYGTYTSHSDIKRWNRDAEAATESAEAVAAIAAQYGFKYPKEEFRRNWEDICWNHHHDTLPGTSIHPSYDYSEKMYQRVIESSRRIGDEATQFLAAHVSASSPDVLVFNPSPWRRDGVVSVRRTDTSLPAFVGDLPPMGYRVVSKADLINSAIGKGPSVLSSDTTLENGEWKVVFDPNRGVVTSIFDKTNQRECIAPGGSGNRLEIHWEDPSGMSAWGIGKIQKVEALEGEVLQKAREGSPVRSTLKWQRKFRGSTIEQTVSLSARGAPEFSLSTEWKEIGTNKSPNPFLKVAFDVNVQNPKVTYQIPFGTIEKPADNHEYPALKFVDMSDDQFGAALINDCKHGYSAQGNTLRLSLIRSTFNPDPRPNDRPQTAKWMFLPHKGNWREAGVVQAAEAFNHPLLCAVIPARGATTQPASQPTLPAEMSFLAFDQPNVIITGVKQAEDDDSLVVRFYEAFGRPTTAKLLTPFVVKHTHLVNFVEDELGHEKIDAIPMRPGEIKTLSLVVGGPPPGR
jgi:alpha-mannosidase